MKGKRSEEEEIKISKYIRKIHVETVNEETKGSSSEDEEVGIRKCKRRSRVEIMNKEVEERISLSKQQEYPPEITNTKEDICLEQMK